MKVVQRTDTSKPQSAKVVYVNDFGDNYHRTDMDPSSELERTVRRIRRRYKNIGEFAAASAAYNEYMALLVEKHGGPELFKAKYKDEDIEDFIPPRPRMKNTPVNRYLQKKGILLSSPPKKKPLNPELLSVIDEEYSDRELPVDEIRIDDENVDKSVVKLSKGLQQFQEIKMKDLRDIQSIDYLDEYFNTKNVIANEQTNDALEKVSLSDVLTGKVFDMVKDTSDEDDVVLYKGRFMNRDSIEEIKIFNTLGELGYNSMRLMRQQNVSKKVRRLLKEQESSKKKKKKKKNKHIHQADKFMVDLAGDNGYDNYAQFEKALFDLSYDNNIF